MAAYRRVHDSHHLQADCPGTLRSVIEYGLFFCAGAGSPDRGALSSKPAVAVDRRDRQTDGQTDGRTPNRFMDPAGSAYYAGSDDNRGIVQR